MNIKYNLSFFDEGQKTEKATAKKRQKAREKGQVAVSHEVETAILFIGCFFVFKHLGRWMYDEIGKTFLYGFGLIGDANQIFTESFMTSVVSFMFFRAVYIAMPILSVAMILSILSNLVQVGWHPNFALIRLNFKAIDPIVGMKRLFSFRIILNLIKSILKFAIIISVMYLILKDEISNIPTLPYMGLAQGSIYIFNLIIKLGLSIGFLFLFMAICDFAMERFKLSKDLRMSKQEVKDEVKQSEGDPRVKTRIRQKMKEISMQRMMQDVPHADVVITNPTHYAVALKYDKEKYGDAPIVLAKGVDYLARKIKDLAKESHVEVVENVELARTLYAKVDVGREIPLELYQAVAEILAFVYKLKKVDKKE